MLHQVVEYARKRELAAEPGFAPKDARWAILCTRRGEYLGLVELGDASLKKNPGRHFLKAPDFSFSDMKAGGVTKSHFLIETAGVVAGAAAGWNAFLSAGVDDRRWGWDKARGGGAGAVSDVPRSEERRVGKECRSRW